MPNLGCLDRSVPSLSAGNIASIAVQVTLAHWQTYMVKSLVAHLLLYLTLGIAVLILILAASFVAVVSGDNASVWMVVLSLGMILGVPIAAYGFARFTATGGLLARLVFNVLANQTEPEPVSQKQIYSRTWAYLRASLWFGLVMGLIYLALGAIAVGLVWTAIPLMDGIRGAIVDTETGPLILLLLFILALLVFLALGLLIYYVTARFWFYDIVLALKDRVSAQAAVGRSWQLTQALGWQVTTVMFIGSLVTLPVILLTTAVNIFVPVAGFLGSIFMFPLWQAMKAVSYYDCATINEGLTFDLETVSAPPQRFLRRVAIQTPESLELDFALGGIGSRAFAWVVDQTVLYLVLTLFWLLGAALYAYVLVPTVTETLGTGSLEQLSLWLLAIAGLLSYGISNGYYIGFETFWQGQTPGKRLAKIRVVQDNGQPVGLREASLRSLIGPIDVGVLLVGFLLISLSQSEKRLGDLAAGTLVIQDQTLPVRQQATTQMQFADGAPETAQSLLAQTNVKALTGDQYLVLQKFLGYRSRLSPTMQTQVTTKLVAQLRQIITPPDQDLTLNVSDRELLEAAYLACRELSA
jgi:uncharacterized RDD family membrane protein YckC